MLSICLCVIYVHDTGRRLMNEFQVMVPFVYIRVVLPL